MNGVLPPYLLLLITLHIVNHSDRDAIAYMNGVRAAGFCRPWSDTMELLEECWQWCNAAAATATTTATTTGTATATATAAATTNAVAAATTGTATTATATAMGVATGEVGVAAAMLPVIHTAMTNLKYVKEGSARNGGGGGGGDRGREGREGRRGGGNNDRYGGNNNWGNNNWGNNNGGNNNGGNNNGPVASDHGSPIHRVYEVTPLLLLYLPLSCLL